MLWRARALTQVPGTFERMGGGMGVALGSFSRIPGTAGASADIWICKQDETLLRYSQKQGRAKLRTLTFTKAALFGLTGRNAMDWWSTSATQIILQQTGRGVDGQPSLKSGLDASRCTHLANHGLEKIMRGFACAASS